jgi:hypothetical protein
VPEHALLFLGIRVSFLNFGELRLESLVSWFLADSNVESEIADLFDFLLSHGPAGMLSSTSASFLGLRSVSWTDISSWSETQRRRCSSLRRRRRPPVIPQRRRWPISTSQRRRPRRRWWSRPLNPSCASVASASRHCAWYRWSTPASARPAAPTRPAGHTARFATAPPLKTPVKKIQGAYHWPSIHMPSEDLVSSPFWSRYYRTILQLVMLQTLCSYWSHF